MTPLRCQGFSSVPKNENCLALPRERHLETEKFCMVCTDLNHFGLKLNRVSMPFLQDRVRDVKFEPKIVQIGPKSGIFSDQISVLFGSESET